MLLVPPQPSFSLGDVALLLGRQRSIVRYWQQTGKLPTHRDFRQQVYVTREDLMIFMGTYLTPAKPLKLVVR